MRRHGKPNLPEPKALLLFEQNKSKRLPHALYSPVATQFVMFFQASDVTCHENFIMHGTSLSAALSSYFFASPQSSSLVL